MIQTIVLATLLLAAAISANTETYCAFMTNADPPTFEVRDGIVDGCVATLTHNATRNTTGWDKIELAVVAGDWKTEVQMAGLGFVEGFVTHEAIFDHLSNTAEWLGRMGPGATDSDASSRLQTLPPWVNDELTACWTEFERRSQPDTQDGRRMRMIREQLVAMRDGYNAAADDDHQLDIVDFAAGAAMPEISLMYERQNDGVQTSDGTYDDRTDSPLATAFVVGRSSTGNEVHDDVIVAHNTVSFYGAMLRTIKAVDLTHLTDAVPVPRLLFTSYPGLVCSSDDLYHTSANITAVRVPFVRVLNNTLVHEERPSLPAWPRALLASWEATTGADWGEFFANQTDPGTDAAQWLVVDANGLVAGSPLPAGTLTSVEQIPGMTRVADVTDKLSHGPVRSFGLPSDHEISASSGFSAACQMPETGQPWCYQTNPRGEALMQHTSADDVNEAKRVISDNTYRRSDSDPAEGVAPRYDLRSPLDDRAPFGAIDGKVVHVATGVVSLRSGPTTGDGRMQSWEFGPDDDMWTPCRGLPANTAIDFPWTDVELGE